MMKITRRALGAVLALPLLKSKPALQRGRGIPGRRSASLYIGTPSGDVAVRPGDSGQYYLTGTISVPDGVKSVTVWVNGEPRGSFEPVDGEVRFPLAQQREKTSVVALSTVAVNEPW